MVTVNGRRDANQSPVVPKWLCWRDGAVVFMKIKRLHLILAILVLAIGTVPLRIQLQRPAVAAIETGIDNISVILTPVDFRRDELPAPMANLPEWTPELYASIKQELAKLGPLAHTLPQP